MKKIYTLYFSVSSKNKSDFIVFNSEQAVLDKVFKKTSDMINSFSKSPSKEVINKILQYAKN